MLFFFAGTRLTLVQKTIKLLKSGAHFGYKGQQFCYNAENGFKVKLKM